MLEQLAVLASEAEQLEYERNVPNVDITDELISQWFDAVYHPDSAPFASCFSPEQLSELAKFTSFFDERIGRLPPSKGTVKTWLADPTWREVMNNAAETLQRIAV